MKRILLTTAIVILAASFGSSAWAQYDSYTTGRPIYTPYTGWGSHSSTAGEGWLRGRAEVIRSMGEYNYNSSLAAINAEEARARYIENRKQYTQTYFEMKEINRQARAEARGPRPTAEDLARYAKEQMPDRLTARQIDTDRGAINWPRVFENEQFAAEREAIDALARQDLTAYGSEGENYAQAKTLLGAMGEDLRTRIDTLPTAEYIAAKKFLIGLDLEFRSPQVSAALAAK